MRTVELAKVAVAAESLRLRRLAKRQAMRAAYAAGAAVFGIAVLVGLHVTLWTFLAPRTSPVLASVIVVAVDVVIAAVLAFLALRNTPGAIEEEARIIRTQAVAEVKRSMTFMGMAAEMGGAALRTGARAGLRRKAGDVVLETFSRLIGR